MSDSPSGRHFRKTAIGTVDTAPISHRRTDSKPSDISVTIPLLDAGRRQRRTDFLLGIASRTILVLLWALVVTMAIVSFLPDGAVSALLDRSVAIASSTRLWLILATVLLGATAVVLSKPLWATWNWAHLPVAGTLSVRLSGLTVSHEAVLKEPLELSWKQIRAVAIDSGRFDRQLTWRRFPMASADGRRSFLFSGEAPAHPAVVLVAGRPVAPNVAIVFTEPLPVQGMGNAISGLLLHVAEMRTTRKLMMQTGLLRDLRSDDLP